ncbi:uncharacterized protein LOC131048551 [Cryptomeria japonica]|uniref:uncharacterized protein LOC131048551 n=1 Tax=Cryptomeria japonica TaxID=3369 RepID=UPI0025AD5866|nr:uncharacterized protein LOC131048551 [Cryptomeria japonica]XP_057838530.1 uncharacterized protein LOC131048551 [Cryptomeria japonica]
MAEYLCSLCCCSCCGSPPQALQQEQANSISSPQLPPHQQTITGHSTTSEQEPIAGSSTATMTDFKKNLHKFNDISRIYALIPVLEELLKIASGEKSDGGSDSAAGSYIQDGQIILEMLDKRIGKRPKNSMDGTIAEIEQVFIEVLKSSEKIPKVGMALCMLGSVLERFSKMSENRSECLEVLRRMLNLGKQILQLNEQIPEQKQKLNEGIQCIVVGTSMCISQLARANIFRFLTATVNADSLKAFQVKIDRFYFDMQLSTAINIGERVIDIGERVPKIASQSQKIYAYQPRVGIEGGLESVIQLLDLDAQDAIPIVVVVYGFGGIGKTTLAEPYMHNSTFNLQSYKHCRIHMDEDCTKNDLKGLQEQILHGSFKENLQLKNGDEGRGRLWSFFKENPNQPFFLYIDNGLKSTDLEQLLPQGLGSCLPPKSRILITTRNLHEMDILISG